MPDKRTVNIHGKEYEVVASRVERFRKDHPGFAILTVIEFADDKRVVIKAEIADDKDRVVATGFAEETRGSSMINKTSALENAETSSIGRALACYGYIGGEYASADEVANAIKQQGEKKPYPTGDELASPGQKAYLLKYATENSLSPGMSKADSNKAVIEMAGRSGIDWETMTAQECQELLEEMRRSTAEETSTNEPNIES